MFNHFLNVAVRGLAMRRYTIDGDGYRVFFKLTFSTCYEQRGNELVVDYDCDGRISYSMPSRVTYGIEMEMFVRPGLSERKLACFDDYFTFSMKYHTFSQNYRNLIVGEDDTCHLRDGYDPFLWSRSRRYSKYGVPLYALYEYEFWRLSLGFDFYYKRFLDSVPFDKPSKAKKLFAAVFADLEGDRWGILENWNYIMGSSYSTANFDAYWSWVKSRYGYRDDDIIERGRFYTYYMHLKDTLFYHDQNERSVMDMICARDDYRSYLAKLLDSYLVPRAVDRYRSDELVRAYGSKRRRNSMPLVRVCDLVAGGGG